MPAIVKAVRSLRAATATIDGEAVICDERGISDFDALRSALARRDGSRAAFLYAFDLLELDGRETIASKSSSEACEPGDRGFKSCSEVQTTRVALV